MKSRQYPVRLSQQNVRSNLCWNQKCSTRNKSGEELMEKKARPCEKELPRVESQKMKVPSHSRIPKRAIDRYRLLKCHICI